MTTEDSSPARMKQIMQVDTKALLDSLKELELKLSDYSKDEKRIPMWASSLEPRLAMLESRISDLHLASKQGHAPSGQTADVQSLVIEEHILDKVKREIKMRTEALQLSMDSKINSSNMELDRVNKLLSIILDLYCLLMI